MIEPGTAIKQIRQAIGDVRSEGQDNDRAEHDQQETARGQTDKSAQRAGPGPDGRRILRDRAWSVSVLRAMPEAQRSQPDLLAPCA
jgi:hypothetical protein